MSINIALADNSELVRIGLRTVIRVNLPQAHIFDVKNSKELQALLQESPLDVLLIDYTATGFSLHQVVEIKKKYPSVHCIAVTYLQSGKTLETSLKAGITSYVKKDCDGKEIVQAVKKTLQGERFFCKDILRTIEQDAIAVEHITFNPKEVELMSISPREKDIVCMIASGLTNNEIADKLFLSTHTVNTHRRNIMAKLGINNTAGIVMYAIKSGWMQPNKFLFSQSV